VSSRQSEVILSTRRAVLARAGLVAGGAGVALLHGAAPSQAQTVGETMDVAPPAGDPALKLRPSGPVPSSSSLGGAMNLDNSASMGAGAVFYSDRGPDAVGRLLVVNQSNAANPQHAVRIQNAGLAHTVSIYHDPAGGAGDATAEALDVVSTNPLDTTVGIHGREEGRGTVKITHEKPAGPDANASALSICLIGNGTAAQGIYIGNDAGIATTGPLLNIRNGGPGSERLVLTADGRLDLPVPGSQAGLMIGSDASLYRSARQMLATAGGLEVRTLLAHQSVTISVRLANPPAPTAAAQARMYVKGAKLVIQWNTGQEILYTAIPLDSPGPYPAAAAITTDVTPP
jgi:hypothetical protein